MTAVLATMAATVGLAVVAHWLRRQYLLVTVDGRSMEPTYRAGDRILVRRRSIRDVRVGQVVVGRYPQPVDPYDIPGVPRHQILRILPEDRLFLKRVVALPGDPVPRERVPALTGVTEPAVPPDRLVVLGDNAAISYDSREFGYLRGDQLVGVTIRRVG